MLVVQAGERGATDPEQFLLHVNNWTCLNQSGFTPEFQARICGVRSGTRHTQPDIGTVSPIQQPQGSPHSSPVIRLQQAVFPYRILGLSNHKNAISCFKNTGQVSSGSGLLNSDYSTRSAVPPSGPVTRTVSLPKVMRAPSGTGLYINGMAKSRVVMRALA